MSTDALLEKTKQFWERPQAGQQYDREFSSLVGWYMNVSETTPVHELLAAVKGKRILDVGCGTGRHLRLLDRQDQNELYGVDQSKEMLKEAIAKNPDAHFFTASAETLPFESGMFDVVYSVRVLQHIRDQKRAVDEMARVCRPGGTVMIISYNAWSLLNAYKHLRMSRLGRLLNMPFAPILKHRSFFNPWGFSYDNYCSIPELAGMMKKSGLTVTLKWGITCGMPWFFNSFFIGKILGTLVPTFFRAFLAGCLWTDRHLARVFPLKYFIDMILVRGKKGLR